IPRGESFGDTLRVVPIDRLAERVRVVWALPVAVHLPVEARDDPGRRVVSEVKAFPLDTRHVIDHHRHGRGKWMQRLELDQPTAIGGDGERQPERDTEPASPRAARVDHGLALDRVAVRLHGRHATIPSPETGGRSTLQSAPAGSPSETCEQLAV